ncbi:MULTISPECIES: hypothetical protein [unclassified Burkholderia]|uniref:hypothetical protein n=1 Tax=unclassified Burkholderia TaxID=2613784 RepID=UPI000F5719B5|nr:MULTISPECIES: hypothetical protein [unclassified Burkholderia]RQS29437.1 hypothetical protein DIE05_13615 [Burkholderia sp. Bp8995]RQS47683.1 hypothetical protein DIE00_14195 [Burkholderia sp. Bp8989]
MSTIDFTRTMWGHAIHAFTFRAKKATKQLDRHVDTLLRRRRYTVMVHTAKPIQRGDTILYKTDRGDVEAKVVDVDWCLDPRDMATLEILVTGAMA